MLRYFGLTIMAASFLSAPMPVAIGQAEAQAAEGVPMQEAGTAGEHVDKGAMTKGSHVKKSSKKQKK